MALLKEETLAKKLITKGSLVYIFSFLIAPTGYVVRVLASHTLSVEEVGIFYSILWLITILAAYNDLWLTEALQYFLPKYRIEKKYDHYKTIWITTFVIQLVSGIIIGWMLRLGADWLAIHYFQSSIAIDMLKLFSLYFVLINFFQAFASMYTAFQDVLYDKTIEAIRMYGVLAITIIFWLMGWLSLQTFGYAWMGGLAIWLLLSTSIFLYKYAKTLRLGHYTRDTQLIKKQLSYAFWVFLGMNAWTLLGQVDQQMIVVILGPEAAGYYTNYLSLFSLYAIFVFPFTALLFPIVTELVSKWQDKKVSILLAILYKYFSVFGLLMGGVLVALWPTIATVLYGQAFVYSGDLIRYAGVFVVLNILLVINFGVMAGMGKVKERVIVLWWALLVNVVWNLLFMLVFGWGLPGAIVATVAGWSVMLVLTSRLVYKHYMFMIDWWFIIRNIFAIALLSIGLWYGQGWFDWSMDTPWMLRLAYLVLLVGGYACILLGINYRSIVTLWKEIHILRMHK